MKKVYLLFALAILLLAASGCQMDMNKAASAAGDLYNAASISDDELKQVCVQMRAVGDKENKVAAPGSKYAQRLNKLTAKFKTVDGQKLNYKVYMVNEVNANATADGSIRVYSGLMDMMNDDELRFVLGHEIGHVIEGHSLNAIRMAYASSAAIKAAGAASGTVGALTEGQLGGLLHEVINAQFSQAQETSSDDYGLNFLKKNGFNTKGAVGALKKLAELGGKGSITSSHPDPASRAARMESLVNAK